MHVTDAHDAVIPSVSSDKQLREANRQLDKIAYGTRFDRFVAWLKRLCGAH
jgi:hypothetical protein